MDLGPVLGAIAVVGGIAALWWALSGDRSAQATTNLMAGIGERTPDVRAMVLAQGAGERVGQPLLDRLGRLGRRLTPAGRMDALAKRLVQAGNPRGLDVTRLIALKAGLGLVGATLGGLRLFAQPNAMSLLLAFLFTGGLYQLPESFVNIARSKRYELARVQAADLIDQLTVTVEAGLGLEAAMAHVAAANVGPLAEEMQRTLQDVRTGVPRARALREMAERLDVPEVRQVAFAIIESERHGLPISETLRVQSDELRVKRRQRAEEKALKLPVKIVFPTLFCIMPSLFIVILGPAAIRLINNL